MRICAPRLGGLWILALVAVAGCTKGDGQTAHLRGTVTLGGRPIPAEAESTITFRTTTVNQAAPVSGRIVNGQFDVADAPLGPVRAVFSIELPTGVKAFAPGADPEMQHRSLVPEKLAAGMPLEIKGDNLEMKLEL